VSIRQVRGSLRARGNCHFTLDSSGGWEGNRHPEAGLGQWRRINPDYAELHGWSAFLRHLVDRGLKGVALIISDACRGLVESVAEYLPEARWQRCVVHFYRNVFSHVPATKVREVSHMLKAIHAQESQDTAERKANAIIADLRAGKMSKAADIIGLYLRPPQHAAVFCIDEKTAIQALDRLDPVLPLSPGRAERHGFEYYRHGTLSLYAALDTKTGRVHGKTSPRHTSRDFVAFLEEVVALCPRRQEIHVILDNLAAHKTQLVREFLARHPRVKFHFTPTYSSWLNQVELWFAKIEREVIARGIFTSVPDLARKLRRYINAYSANARPIQWKYSDPSRRLRANEFTATGH